MLTVSAWRSRKDKATETKQTLQLFSGETSTGEKVIAQKKQLDTNNKGVIVKVAGAQKVQISFNHVVEDYACKHAVAWAKGVVPG
eukprot:2380865-Pyramimonas_sp.AAC.1